VTSYRAVVSRAVRVNMHPLLKRSSTKYFVDVHPNGLIEFLRGESIPCQMKHYRDSMSEDEVMAGTDPRPYDAQTAMGAPRPYPLDIVFKGSRVIIERKGQTKDLNEIETIIDWFITMGCRQEPSTGSKVFLQRTWNDWIVDAVCARLIAQGFTISNEEEHFMAIGIKFTKGECEYTYELGVSAKGNPTARFIRSADVSTNEPSYAEAREILLDMGYVLPGVSGNTSYDWMMV
jgi:hypothetical protein